MAFGKKTAKIYKIDSEADKRKMELWAHLDKITEIVKKIRKRDKDK